MRTNLNVTIANILLLSFGEFHTNDCWFCIFVPKVFCPCFFSSSTAPKEAFYISALACVVQTCAIWLNDFTHSVKKLPLKMKILYQNINVVKYRTCQMKIYIYICTYLKR